MMTYKYEVNGKEVTRADAYVAEYKGQNFTVIELVDGKYNGHYINYIPKNAR